MAHDNDWIPHDGGPCPVPGDTIVRVKYRDGRISALTLKADFWNAREWPCLGDWWKWEGEDEDNIIAYRPHVPSEDDR